LETDPSEITFYSCGTDTLTLVQRYRDNCLKQILFITYHFPPDAAVGGLRPLKFAKYLPACGWEPYILTVKEHYYSVRDSMRVRDDRALCGKIFRTPMLGNPSAIYRRLKRVNYVATARLVGAGENVNQEATENVNVLTRWRRFLGSLVSLPDERLGWWPFGTVRAITLLRRYKIDWIYTSGPPHSVHLIGLGVKKLTGVRWVADFRDLWTLPATDDGTILERLERWMEQSVVRNADVVVATTDRMAEAFRQAYSDAVPRSKFVTIWNGFDAEDFVKLERENRKTFRILYLGSLYMSRTPEPLFKALSELFAEGRMERDRVEIQLVGDCEYANGRRMVDIVDSVRLSRVVKIMPPVSYREALAKMVDCEVLLLLAPNQAYEIPGKAFEYLASGSDVLTVTEDGATADLMRHFERAMVVHPEDAEGMKRAVARCYARWKGAWFDQHRTLAEDVRVYERKELAKELASILEGRTVAEESEVLSIE